MAGVASGQEGAAVGLDRAVVAAAWVPAGAEVGSALAGGASVMAASVMGVAAGRAA